MVLDDDGRHLDLMVAGHPPPFRVSEDSVEQIGENGPILGAFKDAHWPIQRISLEDDERLVLYTDGVTEADTGDGRFGEERLRDILMSGGSGTELLARLEGRLRDFVSEPTQDDVAALILGPDSREIGSSSTRVELIEHIYDAFNRRAIGELQDLCLPEVELEIPTAQIAGRGGIYQGYAGLAKYEQDLSRIWDDLLITPHWVADVDNWTIVKGRLFARSRGLGMRDLPVAWLWQLQDDRIVRGKTFLDLDRAFSFARSGVG